MSASDSDPVERAKELRSLAMSDPQQVDVDELADILSTPTATPKAHEAAIVALSNVARVRDDIGETFVGTSIACSVDRHSTRRSFSGACDS